MQIVILAGGLGTRLKPITEKIPKAMVETKGKPFVDYQVRYLLNQGFDKILIISGYKSEMIQEYVEKQSWSSQVSFLNEGEILRGTGGALAWAHQKNSLDSKFLLLYGDSFLPIDFVKVAEVFAASNLPALMTVLKNQGEWDKSNVIFQYSKLQRYEKGLDPQPPEMNYIDYGLLGLRSDLFGLAFLKQILGFVPEKWDLAELLTALSKSSELLGFEVFERFYEVGSFQGLKDFEQLLASPQWRDFFDKPSPSQ